MMNFCTLFDSNYLDKGILLYQSLERVTNDFTLYIFCFDDVAYDVLKKYGLKRAVILHHEAFETKELLEKKRQRTKAEYCWTCTTSIIEYVLDNYDVESCTYIDSDLYFFSNPKVLFDEIREANANIAITPHWFPNNFKTRRRMRLYGKYCVQFNYFDQSENARSALSWWKKSCIDWCFCKKEKDRFGDQKYLDEFEAKFNGVHVMNNIGGGVATWNFRKYILKEQKGHEITLYERTTGIEFPLVFYHFHHIRFLDNNKVNTFSGNRSVETMRAVYYPYLRETVEVRKILEDKYGVSFSRTVTQASNPIKYFYQAVVHPRMAKVKTDVIDLEEVMEWMA